MSAEDELKLLETLAQEIYGDYELQELTDLLYLAARQLDQAREKCSKKLPQCEQNFTLIQLAWGSKLPKSD